MRKTRQKTEREPTIALINIVFLMLIFFLVAGTLAQPLDSTLNLVRTADLEGNAPADALVVHPDGRMSLKGQEISSVAEYMAGIGQEAPELVRLVPDRDASAAQLVTLGRELRAAGAQRVVIVTERGLE